MADLAACIAKVVDNNKLTKEQGDDLLERSNSLGVESAIRSALEEVDVKHHDAILNTVRAHQAYDSALKHDKGLIHGILGLLVRDKYDQAINFNVEGQANWLKAQYHSIVTGMIDNYRTKAFGLYSDKEELGKFVKAIFGENTDGLAGQFAGDFKVLLDTMRKDFISAGGKIGEIDDYHLPQVHNREMVFRADADEWVEFTLQRLDIDKMIRNNEFINNVDDLREALHHAKRTIETDGLNKVGDLELMPKNMGKSLSKKHSDSRFLHFKDADSWIEYNTDYGTNDIFSVVTSHIENMANDTSMMRILGANPEQVFEAILRQGLKEGKLDKKHLETLRSQYKVISGAVNDKGNPDVANFMQGTRNLITASKLGSAVISAISDVSFSAITSAYNGLSPVKTLFNHLDTLGSHEKRVFAVELGLGADAFIGTATGANRFGETYGNGYTAKMSEVTMRGSGLSVWTDAGRKAFGMEFSNALASQFSKNFSGLNTGLRKSMTRYGIDGEDWDKFRKSAVKTRKGAKYADFAKDKSGKFINMILAETDYAVPTPDGRVRRWQTMGKEAGTAHGEVTRSLMQLKSFSITLINTHVMRMLTQNTPEGKVGYASALILSTTIMGALTLQAKDMAAGREPRDMGDDFQSRRKFWSAAMAQGGGMGIMGDFLFSDTNRFGGGLVDTMAGPSAGLINDTTKLTLGNLQQMAKGEETEFVSELTNFAKSNTPKVWQTRLLIDGIYDRAAIMADPSAQKRLNRSMKKRRKEFGQDYWWKKGEILPEVAQ